MHQLHLLRHAKSSPDDAVEDRERPLNRRGREAARRVGELLPAAIGPVDLVLCSSALRTRQTLELSLAGFSPRPTVLYEDGLYLASRATLLRRLQRVEEGCAAVLLIGHNPGLHELALALADPASPEYDALAGGKFPTAARASFRLAGRWQAIAAGRHRMTAYVTPKSPDD